MIAYGMKKYFFDTPKIQKLIGDQRATYLRNAGGYIQKTAQRLMKRVGKKGKPSPAGQPPRYHGGDPSLRTILYAFDPATGNMIVGPVGFNQKFYVGTELVSGTIPRLHEKGGVLGIREKRVGSDWVPLGRRKPRPGQPVRRRKAEYKPRPYMEPAAEKTAKTGKFSDLFHGRAAA